MSGAAKTLEVVRAVREELKKRGIGASLKEGKKDSTHIDMKYGVAPKGDWKFLDNDKILRGATFSDVSLDWSNKFEGTLQEAREWVEIAGVFLPEVANKLKDLGVTPAEAGKIAGPDIGIGKTKDTVGYKLSTGDLTFKKAVEFIKEGTNIKESTRNQKVQNIFNESQQGRGWWSGDDDPERLFGGITVIGLTDGSDTEIDLDRGDVTVGIVHNGGGLTPLGMVSISQGAFGEDECLQDAMESLYDWEWEKETSERREENDIEAAELDMGGYEYFTDAYDGMSLTLSVEDFQKVVEANHTMNDLITFVTEEGTKRTVESGEVTTLKGEFITMSFPADDKNSLSIKITDEGKTQLEEWKAEDTSAPLCNLEHLVEFFEDIIADSSLDWVHPEEIGALTDAPMIGEVERDDMGEITEVYDLWYFGDYVSWCTLELLDEKGEVLWQHASTDDVKEGTKRTVESGEVTGWIAVYGDKKLEIPKSDEIPGIYQAKMYAIKTLKVPKSEQGLLAIAPAYNESKNLTTESTESKELTMYIQNDEQLYNSQALPAIKNLVRKKAAGTYDPDLAVKLFKYLADAGAKKYVKEFGAPGDAWYKMFSKTDRQATAVELRNQFETDYADGEYDEYTPKKYQKDSSESRKTEGYLKMKPEHFETMKAAIQEILDKNPGIAEEYMKAGLSWTRFAFDLMYAMAIDKMSGSQWVSKVIYPYMDDTHLKTALKQIVPQKPWVDGGYPLTRKSNKKNEAAIRGQVLESGSPFDLYVVRERDTSKQLGTGTSYGVMYQGQSQIDATESLAEAVKAAGLISGLVGLDVGYWDNVTGKFTESWRSLPVIPFVEIKKRLLGEGETFGDLDEFTTGFLTALMWADLSDEDGNPLDEYGLSDLHPETVSMAKEECAKFQEENSDLLSKAYESGEWYNQAQAGHDFALTRNGHGAGFWDRDLGEVGDKLSEEARAYGELNGGLSDDGLVVFESRKVEDDNDLEQGLDDDQLDDPDGDDLEGRELGDTSPAFQPGDAVTFDFGEGPVEGVIADGDEENPYRRSHMLWGETEVDTFLVRINDDDPDSDEEPVENYILGTLIR